MSIFSKIISIFVLYMLLCIPALAAQTVGGYVSNTPMAAGPNASLGEVWMRHGGARLQYDALMGTVQTNTNGVMRRDPAAVKILPPIPVQKSTRYKYSRPKKKISTATKKTTTKKIVPGTNTTHKPTINNKTVRSPYSGVAPSAPSAPSAPATSSMRSVPLAKGDPAPPPGAKTASGSTGNADIEVISPTTPNTTVNQPI